MNLSVHIEFANACSFRLAVEPRGGPGMWLIEVHEVGGSKIAQEEFPFNAKGGAGVIELIIETVGYITSEEMIQLRSIISIMLNNP